MLLLEARCSARLFGPIGVLLLVAGCQPSSQTREPVNLVRDGTTVEDGSTLTVRTTSGSVWGGEGHLIEEAAIGTETRGEQDLLGQVYGIDATGDRIFILDRVYSTVRVFDMAGVHIMNIGRPGPGPGELGSPTDLGIDPSRQQLVVRESIAGVTHRFTLEGKFIGSSPATLQGGLSGTGLLLRVTRKGSAMIPSVSWRWDPDRTAPPVRAYVLYTIDSTGTKTDSLDLPESGDEEYILKAHTQDGRSYRPEPVPFAPQKVWSIGWDGSLITGYAVEYKFEIRYPDGRRTIIEREADAAPVLPEERESAQRKATAILRDVDPSWTWHGPKIPDKKPWYTAIIPDRSGRLWVLREGKGQRVEGWVEPDNWRGWRNEPEWVSETWFDVFEEATGRYLGRVDTPEGFTLEPEPLIEGDMFICLTEDELGRPIVRVYRLKLPV